MCLNDLESKFLQTLADVHSRNRMKLQYVMQASTVEPRERVTACREHSTATYTRARSMAYKSNDAVKDLAGVKGIGGGCWYYLIVVADGRFAARVTVDADASGQKHPIIGGVVTLVSVLHPRGSAGDVVSRYASPDRPQRTP
jgi:hypothetical protein